MLYFCSNQGVVCVEIIQFHLLLHHHNILFCFQILEFMQNEVTDLGEEICLCFKLHQHPDFLHEAQSSFAFFFFFSSGNCT